ncbi:MAG TPA: serine/threonine-protein kinase, partial [Candidatus Eisenbacteria bacterium]|nr:serine/threonine-protein kinase [Candidatus Eisenbacteria bacterium]
MKPETGPQSSKPDDLAGVAEAITDGTRVDWGRVGDSRGLSGLKLIEQLGHAYAGAPEPEASAAPMPVFQSGERLGPYRIEGELGRGGMGVVYLARDLRLDREVAVKALPAGLASNPVALERLAHEARILASLDHPGIAVIHGMEETAEGARFLVLERVRGVTLGARLRTGAMPMAEALNVATQLGEALQAAHEGNVIHRDLKPGNVMLTASGRVKVLDFGLARPAGDSSPANEGAPRTVPAPDATQSSLEGTAGYVSPERLQGIADARADVFAFGAVLYECLTGTPAFPGATSEAVLAAVLASDPDFSRLPAETPE